MSEIFGFKQQRFPVDGFLRRGRRRGFDVECLELFPCLLELPSQFVAFGVSFFEHIPEGTQLGAERGESGIMGRGCALVGVGGGGCHREGWGRSVFEFFDLLVKSDQLGFELAHLFALELEGTARLGEFLGILPVILVRLGEDVVKDILEGLIGAEPEIIAGLEHAHEQRIAFQSAREGQNAARDEQAQSPGTAGHQAVGELGKIQDLRFAAQRLAGRRLDHVQLAGALVAHEPQLHVQGEGSGIDIGSERQQTLEDAQFTAAGGEFGHPIPVELIVGRFGGGGFEDAGSGLEFVEVDQAIEQVFSQGIGDFTRVEFDEFVGAQVAQPFPGQAELGLGLPFSQRDPGQGRRLSEAILVCLDTAVLVFFAAAAGAGFVAADARDGASHGIAGDDMGRWRGGDAGPGGVQGVVPEALFDGLEERGRLIGQQLFEGLVVHHFRQHAQGELSERISGGHARQFARGHRKLRWVSPIGAFPIPQGRQGECARHALVAHPSILGRLDQRAPHIAGAVQGGDRHFAGVEE